MNAINDNTTPEPTIQNCRLQGIACALGELAAGQGERDLAHRVLSDLGLTVADLIAAGAEQYDLDNLAALDLENRTA